MLVIVGSGHGGVETAQTLRRRGYDGPLTMLSDEACLPYHKPPLSKAFLKDKTLLPQLLRPEKFYQQNQIELRLGVRVLGMESSSRRLLLHNGEKLDFSHLVLATGARPRILPIPGLDLENILYLHNIQEAMALREAVAGVERIIVIGGGFIGMELASTLVAQGKSVCVLEAAPRILGRAVAPAMSRYMTQRHRDSGMEIRTDVKIERLQGDGRKVDTVVLADGRTLSAEVVIIGAGAVPNSELLAQAGMDCDKGIQADSCLRTSIPDSWAIGDCVFYPHWQAEQSVRLESIQNATDQARHIAASITGKNAPYRKIPWFWSDQGENKLQMAGLSFGGDSYVISGSMEENSFSIWCFGGGRLLGVDSLNRPGDHMLARQLLEAGTSPSAEQIGQGRDVLKSLVTGKSP